MAVVLRQSTSVVITLGPFLLQSDGVTLVTNLVGTGSNQTENTSTGIRISKNGGAFAARHATATASSYDAFGNYLVTLDTTDTGTLGVLRVQFADGAHFCPVWQDFMIVPANVWDSFYGASLLQIDVTKWLTGTIPAVNVTGVPLVDAKYLLGTVFATPATAGIPDVNTKNLGGTAQTGRDIGASVLLSTGTGTGQLDFTAGVVKSNLAQILGTVLTETAGQIAGGFKQFFNIGAPSSTMNTITTVTTATNLTNNNDKTGYGLSSAAVQAIWDAATSALTTAGSIGKKLADWAIGTTQTGDSFARLGAPAGASVSADIAAIKSDTGAVKSAFISTTGTATAGSGNTITLPSALGADSLPNGSLISIVGGTGVGQCRVITGYVNSTKVVTVGHNWTTNPDNTSVFYIINTDAPKVDSTQRIAEVVLTDTLTTYTGNTVQTGDSFARLGAPVGASTSADIAGVQTDTTNIKTRIPASLVSGRMDASVGAYQSGQAPLQPTTAGRTLVVDAAGLADANVVKLGPTGSGTAQTARDIGASVLVGDKTGFSLSSAGIQAIWDALTSALTTVGSIGKRLADNIDALISSRLASASYTAPPTVVAIRTEMDTNSTKLAHLDADMTSRASQSSLDADTTKIDAIKAKTDNLPASPAATGDIPTSKITDLWQIQGLDHSNPMTVTPTSRAAASIAMVISGDGITSTTVTRS